MAAGEGRNDGDWADSGREMRVCRYCGSGEQALGCAGSRRSCGGGG